MHKALAVLALAGMASCAPLPAMAATYGPSLPSVPAISERDRFVVMPDETLEQAEQRYRDDTRSAWRTFWIGQGLVAADMALTCTILARGGRELNPIYGKGASCGKILGIRAGVSVLQYVLFRHAVKRDPASAKKAARWSLVLQGVPVAWNAAQLAK